MSSRSVVVILVVAVALVACGGDASSPTPSAAESPTTSPATSEPTAAPTDSGGQTASVSPTGPSEDGFSCDLPIVEAGTAPIANILDVRVGTHDGYDRLVFEFAQGIPEFTLDRAEPPFTEDGSGAPIEVEGSSFLELVMRGGTKQTDEGTSSYEGVTEFDPGFPMLVSVVETGDFERQSTWILGLADAACVRILLLDGPPRLVIDVER